MFRERRLLLPAENQFSKPVPVVRPGSPRRRAELALVRVANRSATNPYAFANVGELHVRKRLERAFCKIVPDVLEAHGVRDRVYALAARPERGAVRGPLSGSCSLVA